MRFSMRTASTTATAPRLIPVHPDANPRTILIVDDRAINRDFLVSLLKHFGYKLREAESAEQAWGMAVTGGVDLIITDVHMNGMDGYTLLEKLAAHPDTLRIPAIVYTAEYKNPGFGRFVVAHQLYKVLTKPSAPELIVEAVRGALGESADPIAPLEQGHRTTSLIEIMQDLAELVEPAKLVRAFCKAATALLYAERGFVYLLSRGAEHPPQAFSSDMEEFDSLAPADDRRLTSTLTQIISGHAVGHFRHMKPNTLGLPFGDKEISSMLCVPIFTSAHNYGCLCLVGKIADEEFNHEDEHLVQTLASHLSMLYENAVFFDELQGLTARLGHEVEERKRAQEELERSRKEQIRLKDQFFSHVSHELRSPVMVVQQFLEILEEGSGGELSSQQHEYVDVALRNITQLHNMIGDLLEATRIEAGKLRVDVCSMPLLEVLNEAVDSARPSAKQKQISLTFDAAAALPLVIADRSRVRQIVTNLLDNAIKFTPQNGTVSVHVGMSEDDAKFVRVKVLDTGCGIPPEESPKVFDRLYQVPNADCAARKGLGLGLCICKQLVTLQGGDIQVQSQPNSGSVFSFTLPVFSLANLVTPILGEGAVPMSMILLTVELGEQHAIDNKPALAALREVIERCVLPGLDAVMPGTYHTRSGQMFAVLARADEHGGRVLARRIEEQLKLTTLTADLSSVPAVRLSTISLAARNDLAVAEQRAAVASQIEEHLNAILVDRS